MESLYGCPDECINNDQLCSNHGNCTYSADRFKTYCSCDEGMFYCFFTPIGFAWFGNCVQYICIHFNMIVNI